MVGLLGEIYAAGAWLFAGLLVAGIESAWSEIRSLPASVRAAVRDRNLSWSGAMLMVAVLLLAGVSLFEPISNLQREQRWAAEVAPAITTPNPDIERYSYRVTPQGGSGASGIATSVGVRLTNHGTKSVTVFAGLVSLSTGAPRVDAQQRRDLLPGEEGLLTFIAWGEGSCYKPAFLLPESESGLQVLITMADERFNKELGSLTANGDVRVDFVDEIDRVCTPDI
jgi:hypothetical protein